MTSCVTGAPPIFTFNTACGCMKSLISRKPFLMTTNMRMFFIPPPVEPAHPPMNISRIRTTLDAPGHASKFSVQKPVVVIIEVD